MHGILTVIIPVYKVEATLDRCIESVVGQTYKQLEILLVDDGSPDKCPMMCEQWAKKDGRIKVIHKPNGGLSSARNAGLDAAQGEYITFVDSDDFIDKTTFSSVIELFDDKTDIVEYPIFRFYGSGKQEILTFENKTYDSKEEYWFSGQAYTHSYACNKIYRKDIFKYVRFPIGKNFEDMYTMPLLIQKARRIATVNTGLYYYCYNPKGITATADGDALRQLLNAHVGRFAPITDETYYLHVLNIQLDVAAATGDKPTLNALHINNVWNKGFKNGIKLSLLNIVGLERLCKIWELKKFMK